MNQAQSRVQEIATYIQVFSPIIIAFFGFVILRFQRDLEKFKNELTTMIEEKFITRNEHAIILRDHEACMARNESALTESRKQHHILHEEFIACKNGKE